MPPAAPCADGACQRPALLDRRAAHELAVVLQGGYGRAAARPVARAVAEEARRGMRLLALAIVLAQIVAPTPTTWTIPADPALAPALVALAGVDEGRALLQALADAGVRLVVAVAVAPEANGTTERLAEFRPASRLI